MVIPYCAQVAGLPGVYRVRSVNGSEALIQQENGCWAVLYGFDPDLPVPRSQATLPARLDLSDAARAAAELVDTVR